MHNKERVKQRKRNATLQRGVKNNGNQKMVNDEIRRRILTPWDCIWRIQHLTEGGRRIVNTRPPPLLDPPLTRQ